MNLLKYLAPIKKNAPEVVTPFIEQYCQKSLIKGDTTFNYGYGSLKWALKMITSIDKEAVTQVFFSILCESAARQIAPETLQFHCYKLFSLRRYMENIHKIDTIDVTRLPYTTIGPLKVIINTTGRTNILSHIFRSLPDTAIVVAAARQLPAAISFHPTIEVSAISEPLLSALNKKDSGWELMSREKGPSTFINRHPHIRGFQYLLEILHTIIE